MTAVAIQTRHRPVPVELEEEILARIDRAVQICEAELRYKLRWDDREHGSLLELLNELEQNGLIESALHFRLTDHGRALLPEGYEPPLRCGTGIPWTGPLMNTGDARNHAPSRGDLAGELDRRGAGKTIHACRRAGLPVVHEHDCTCRLDGDLVVLAGPGSLRVLWPCDRPCPVHEPPDQQAPRPAARPGRGRSRSQPKQPARAGREGGHPTSRALPEAARL